MTSVSIYKAKTLLSSLISAVEQNGEPIIIEKHGRPVAELIPVPNGSRIKTHPTLKKIKIKGNLLEPTVKEWENV